MKHTRRFFVLFAVTVSLVISALHAHPLAAQQSQAVGNGLKISPVRNDLTIEKGKSQTVTLYIENVTPTKTTIKAIVNDFIADDGETGNAKIILDENQSAPGNSFKSLVPSKPVEMTLEPKERKEVKVTVSVPANASSGGYYGAVRFAPSDSSSSQNVSLSASVGSIFLVRVPGDLQEKLSIVSFDVTKNGKKRALFNNGPVDITARFKNEGNIHVQPFGRVTLKDMRGKAVSSFEINDAQPRGNVLPGTIRKFTSPLSGVGKIGRYTVEGNFGYGSNGQLISAKATFYVIPYWLIGSVVALILFVIFGLPRLIRAYNKRVIASAGKSSRK